jgi:hypothetical protein
MSIEKAGRGSLDEVLALQLVVSWAGETPGGVEKRLGWWKTDLVDPEGGGDLWKRLLPRTHRWAALDAARRAARLTDDKLRRAHARVDKMVTLFHFGFHLDEALDERLAHHKLEGRAPNEVLPLTDVITNPFDAAALLKRLDTGGRGVAVKVVPGGRQLKGAPPEPVEAARQLACAMLQDNPKEYPLPFFVAEARGAER